MKKALVVPSVLIIMALACSLPLAPATPTTIPEPATPTPEVFIARTQAIPLTVAPEDTPTAPPSFEGMEVSFGALSLVVPPGLASGVRASEIAREDGEDAAWWQKTPGHLQLELEGYRLPDKSHQPRIYVFPAHAYAELVPAAFESIRRIDNLLYNPSAPISAEQLPAAPFFNDLQAFVARIQVSAFQNGGGVRFLTQSAQYAAPANNHDLFYHFEGVTRDGAYYVIAILPVTAPMLAETGDGGAVPPPGGVPYPDITDPNADRQGYYAAVTALLDAAAPETFTPALDQLDALIQSMRLSP